jgi:peptide/nickel transport system substrate-binding protein
VTRQRGAWAGRSNGGGHLTRRRLLTAALPVALLAAACGDDTPRGDSRGAPAGGQSAVSSATAVRQPRGELRVGLDRGTFPPGFDPIKTSPSYPLRYGVGETLTRLTPDLKIEPWLADSVTAVDPTTWRVTLRKSATFHDGSPVTAQDVVASIRRVIEGLPAAAAFVPKETEIAAVDPATVTFTTPAPIGTFPNNLSSFYFPIAKQVGETVSYTGPYKVARLETDVQAVLQAFPGHWAGPPPLTSIQLRMVPDINAQLLALQSGDLDLATGLLPEQMKGLPRSVEAKITTGIRLNYVQFHLARPLFADKALREAFALGIDRAAINTAVFDGQGEAATGLFPSKAGGFDVLQIQSTDTGRARQVLETAGWRAGADGVRSKDGVRLAFPLYSLGAGPTAMALVIQAQLKPLGFDIQVQERLDLYTMMARGDFDAVMTSISTLPTGEPAYLYNVTLTKDASFNFGKYTSSQLDALAAQMRAEPDAAKRNTLSRQAQEVVRADIPCVCLTISPRVDAIRAGKVKSYTLHPNDLYLIDNQVSVD